MEEELETTAFQSVKYEVEYVPLPSFDQLPSDGWICDDFPLVRVSSVTAYLKARGGYTRNYRTGVRLCQCGHLFDLEMVNSGSFIYIKAKCRPTMQKEPLFTLFIMLENTAPAAGNC